LAQAISDKASVNEEIIFKVKYNSEQSQTYTQNIAIEDAYRIAIIGQQEEWGKYPVNRSNNILPYLDVKSGAHVFVSRMEFSKSLSVGSGSAIRCGLQGSELWLDQVIIRENREPLIVEEQGTVVVRRSDISDNHDGIVNVTGDLHIENTFITHNHTWDDKNKHPALTVHGYGNTTILYSMILDSPGVGASAIYCPGASDVTIRNSVILGPVDDERPLFRDCQDRILVTESWLNDQTLDLGSNFMRESPDSGVYTAKEGGPDISDEAIWKPGDPYTDFAGNLRPFSENSSDYAGAVRP